MRALTLALLMLPSIALATVYTDSGYDPCTDSTNDTGVWVDPAPDTDTSTSTGTGTGTATGSGCAAPGDACTAEDGHEGTCDADRVCVHQEEGGCNTSGAPVAGGLALLSLGLLALRRSRQA